MSDRPSAVASSSFCNGPCNSFNSCIIDASFGCVGRQGPRAGAQKPTKNVKSRGVLFSNQLCMCLCSVRRVRLCGIPVDRCRSLFPGLCLRQPIESLVDFLFAVRITADFRLRDRTCWSPFGPRGCNGWFGQSGKMLCFKEQPRTRSSLSWTKNSAPSGEFDLPLARPARLTMSFALRSVPAPHFLAAPAGAGGEQSLSQGETPRSELHCVR
jgi:hypothetical protein